MLEFSGRLASMLEAGDLILLSGDLGAGKTTLTRGIARALGSPSAVSSPTFTLIHLYAGGRLPIVHVDAYRLKSAEEVADIGLGDYLNDGESVVIIEWPERIERALPTDRFEITIEEAGEESRTLHLAAKGQLWDKKLDSVRAALGSGAD